MITTLRFRSPVDRMTEEERDNDRTASPDNAVPDIITTSCRSPYDAVSAIGGRKPHKMS